MSKHKIIVFSKFFWPEGGGAELATHLIVKDVLSKYFDLVVVSGTKIPSIDLLKCCKYIYYPTLNTRYKPFEWLKLFANINHIRCLISQADIVYIPSHTLLPLAIIVKSIKPNVKVILHLHDYQPLTYTSVVLANKEPDLVTDIIVEYGEHGSLLRALVSGFGHYINNINVLSLYFADKIICVSRKQKSILAKYIRIVRDKAVVIYNPRPPISDIEKEISNYPTILFSGGGSFIKGFYIVAKVIAEIVAKLNIRVYITYGRTVSMRHKLILDNLTSRFYGKVIDLGRISYERLIALHKHIWALLFPSLWEEPLPYTVVEACLLKTIPVASKVGGVEELVGEVLDREGLIFNPNNIYSLKNAVEHLVNLDKEQVLEIGYELKELVSKKMRDYEKKFINTFERLI